VRLSSRPAFVDERQVRVKVLTKAFGHLHPPSIRSNHHKVLAFETHLVLHVVREQRQGGQMIDGKVEEPLDLSAVQVDRDDPVRSRRGE
jgi:hypothetical protein